VVGVADAYGKDATGKVTHLFGGPLTLNVAVENESARAPWWGLGGALALGSGGKGLTGDLMLATPPTKFMWDRLQVEPHFGPRCSIGSKLCAEWEVRAGAIVRVLR
jgi:hypothetical protein